MPSTAQWLAFLATSMVILQTPGPALLFLIGRALSAGRREAMLSLAGHTLGLVAQVVLAAAGLGALVAASAAAYTVVKLVGAGYLIWLGVQTIRHRSRAREALVSGVPAAVDTGHVLRTAFLVGVTNPKSLVLFVALLPQFIDRSDGFVTGQMLMLGLLFAAMALVSDGIWTLIAMQARAWMARRPERLDVLSIVGGGMMAALGAAMALSARP